MHSGHPVVQRRSTTALQLSGSRLIADLHQSASHPLSHTGKLPARAGFGYTWPLAGLVMAIATTTVTQPWKWTESPVEFVSHAPPLRNVQVTQPTVVATAHVTLPGTLRPWQTATLYARVSGYLKAWHYDLGARVRAGDLLAEIDTPELNQELAQNEALAREAEAAVLQAKAERIEADADLNVAESQLTRAKAELSLARMQLDRREKLLDKNIIVKEEHDTAVRQLETRAAELAAAEFDVARRRANLGTRDAIVASREAAAESRRSNAQRLRELQSFQKITAPFDGVVTRRTAEVGSLVLPGSEPMFVVEDMSRIRVQVNVPQSHAAAVEVGTVATIVLPESAKPGVRADVTRIPDTIDPNSRTMLAEIELDNSIYQLQPGSYSRVTLEIAQEGNAWTIPTNALNMRVDGPHVVVIDDSNHTSLRRVMLGRDLGKRVIISEGIEGHERLVVNPDEGVAQGIDVEVDESKSSGISAGR